MWLLLVACPALAESELMAIEVQGLGTQNCRRTGMRARRGQAVRVVHSPLSLERGPEGGTEADRERAREGCKRVEKGRAWGWK
jgi:hypothetical protein